MDVSKNKIRIQRACDSYPHQTNGLLAVVDADLTPVFACITLELPWKNNQRSVSHIPRGTYKGIKHRSPKFGECVWIKDVPERSEILIHPANYVEQLRGCVAVGQFLMDVDGDGTADDISASRNTMKNILKMLPNEFTVTIEDAE
jgi:hypothetical protein